MKIQWWQSVKGIVDHRSSQKPEYWIPCLFTLMVLILAGCASSQGRKATPIQSDRVIEYLEFDEDGMPQWKRAGTVTVQTSE